MREGFRRIGRALGGLLGLGLIAAVIAVAFVAVVMMVPEKDVNPYPETVRTQPAAALEITGERELRQAVEAAPVPVLTCPVGFALTGGRSYDTETAAGRARVIRLRYNTGDGEIEVWTVWPAQAADALPLRQPLVTNVSWAMAGQKSIEAVDNEARWICVQTEKALYACRLPFRGEDEQRTLACIRPLMLTEGNREEN